MSADNEQAKRFKEAAREMGADMSKEEFARVIGGLKRPRGSSEDMDEGQEADDSP